MAAAFLLVIVALALVAPTQQANGVCGFTFGNYKSVMFPLDPFAPGDEIFINGTIDNNANGVYINLYQGPNPVWLQSDIAFHYRIDFPLNYIIYSSYSAAEGWGAGETSSMRTGRGQQISTVIQATEGGYDVLINGAFAYHYNHRQDVRTVAGIFYYGDWTVDYMELRCAANPFPCEPTPGLRQANRVASLEETRPVNNIWANITSSN